MSHDLSFAVRPGQTAPSMEVIRAYFAERSHWKLGDDNAEYSNPLTGVKIDAAIREPDADEPEGRAPIVIYMSNMRPHFSALEVADEVAAFARAFGLLVEDAQDEGAGKREFEPERFHASFEKYNRWLHDLNLRHYGADPPPTLRRERIEQVWRWNRGRDALAEQSGDAIFVPQIFYGRSEGDVSTWIAWADGIDARVPQVDSIQTTRVHVPWSVIADAIADAPREGGHFVVTGATLARVFAAIEAAESTMAVPRILSPTDVLTKELVDEFVLEPEARERRRRAVDLAMHGRHRCYTGRAKEGLAMMAEAAALSPDDYDLHHELAMFAHQNDDHRLAIAMGTRAFELRPTSAIDALVAGANAMYVARYDDALRLGDAAVALAPEDRNAHLIRATSLTELMRHDEAVEATDRALQIEYDGMAENVKAFALAAGGRAEEAKASYTRALAALDEAIENEPGDADLHSRRAYSLLGLGRPKDALAAARKALSIKKDESLTLQSLGRALLGLDKPKEALVPLTKAMKLRPAPMAAFFAAKAHGRLGDDKSRDQALCGLERSPYFVHLAKTDPDLVGTKRAAPAKKTAAKKTAAKKTTAKKTSAKKPAAKEPAAKKPAKKKAPKKKAPAKRRSTARR